MGDKSKIEWTDASWTPIRARYMEIQNDGSGKERIGWHCEHVSPGCSNCYSETLNHRLGTGLPYKPGHQKDVSLFLDENMLRWPLQWRKPRMIFVCSMTDLFADFVPDEWIDRVFAVMALSPQHTFQLLSKRAARMRAYCSSAETVERIAALVYREGCEQGTDHSLSRGAGRTGNRRRREDLAAEEAAREASSEGRERVSEGGRNNRLSAGPSRVPEPGRLPLDYDNDRPSEDSDRRAPGHLDEQQRTNPTRPDDQSQERGQRRQSLREFGTGDAVGTAAPRDRSLERQSQSAKGEQASEDATQGSGRFADAPDARRRHDGEDDRRSLRDEPEGSIGDLHREDLAARLVWPLPGVWLGVSAEDQARADERIPDLLVTPAAIRFVSAEPLLGPIDFLKIPGGGVFKMATTAIGAVTATGWHQVGINWTIVGGESGPGARPMVLGWAKDIIRQCRAAGVAAYMKQLGARPTNREGVPHPISDRKGANMDEWPEELRVRQFPEVKQ